MCPHVDNASRLFLYFFFRSSCIYLDVCFFTRIEALEKLKNCPRISPESPTGCYILEHLISTIRTKCTEKVICMKCCDDRTALGIYISSHFQYRPIWMMIRQKFLPILESKSHLCCFLYIVHLTRLPYSW